MLKLFTELFKNLSESHQPDLIQGVQSGPGLCVFGMILLLCLRTIRGACAQGEMRKEGCQATDILVSEGMRVQENSQEDGSVYADLCSNLLSPLSFHLIFHKQDVDSNN